MLINKSWFLIFLFILTLNSHSANGIQTSSSPIDELDQVYSTALNQNIDEIVKKPLSEIIVENSLKIDKNQDKIADDLALKEGNLDLLLLFEDYSYMSEDFGISNIKIKEKFTVAPIISIEADASILPLLSALDGLSVIEENHQIKKQLAYSTAQLGIRPYIWDLGLTGSSDFSIAIVDSGIDTSHTAFSDRIIASYNAIEKGEPVIDIDGHGTHVAGIAAGYPITGPSTFNQSTRGTLPDQEGTFWTSQSILLANLNGSVSSINVGMDWGAKGEDNPSSSAFIALVTTQFTLAACGNDCYISDTDGLIDVTFSNIPSGDFYLVFGNDGGAGDQNYEGWAEVAYNTELPSQIKSDSYNAYSGVAPSSNIVVVKALDSQGNGNALTLLDGLNWVADHKMDYNITVVNLSLGSDDTIISSVDSAIANLVNQGIVVVAAAGNFGAESNGIFSPGSAIDAITVGAVNRYNEISHYSSVGHASLNPGIKPDVVASGGSSSIPADGWETDYTEGLGLIVAPDSNNIGFNSVNNDLIGYEGTSMAAPHIAGLAALLVQQMHNTRGWTWDRDDVYRIKRAILAGTFEVGNIGSNGGESLLSQGIPDHNPTVDRDSKDHTEGWGAVDGRAALGALTGNLPLNRHMPLTFSLENPFIPNVYAWTFSIEASKSYEFKADVPIGADIDLLIIDPISGENGDLDVLYSATNGKGINEEIIIEQTSSKELIFVARLVNSDNSQDEISFVLLNPDFVPKIDLISPLNGSYYSSPNLDIIFYSPSNSVEGYLDSVNQGYFSSGDKMTDVSLGSHNLTLIETNLNTGVSDRVYVNFTIDNIDPILVSDLSNLDGITINDSVKINFTATDNFALDRVEIIVDGVLGETLGFPVSEILLNPKWFTSGSHQVILRVYDKAGNSAFESYPIHFEHSIFIVRNQDRIQEIEGSITIDWHTSSDSPDSYWISIDEEILETKAWDGENLTYSFKFNQTGSFNISLFVNSTSGDFAFDSFILTIEDNISPVISGPSSGFYDATEPLFLEFSVDDLLLQRIEMLVDNNNIPFSVDRNKVSLSVEGEPNTMSNVTVIAVDTSGNKGITSINIQWKDLTAPILSEPADLTIEKGTTSASITWEWIEKFVSEVKVFLDDDPIFTVPSPTNSEFTIDSSFLNSLEKGAYSFKMQITDVNGNLDEDTVLVTVTEKNQMTTRSDNGFISGFNFFLTLISIFTTLHLLIKRKQRL
ncbi:MAG: S8 family serine peptidase [Candidatus Kariarchaeaceae archaeon]|jgi:subtilisin family serine protease